LVQAYVSQISKISTDYPKIEGGLPFLTATTPCEAIAAIGGLGGAADGLGMTWGVYGL
jgi:hypothetical protein